MLGQGDLSINNELDRGDLPFNSVVVYGKMSFNNEVGHRDPSFNNKQGRSDLSFNNTSSRDDLSFNNERVYISQYTVTLYKLHHLHIFTVYVCLCYTSSWWISKLVSCIFTGKTVA